MLKRMLLWGSVSLVLLLAILVATVAYLLQHPQWVLKHVNQALAPYQMHIQQIRWQLPDMRTLQLPELVLDYADNQLSFNDIQLTLKQPLSVSQLWGWYQQQDSHTLQQSLVNAIESVSYQDAVIELPINQLLPSTSTEPLWLPIAGTIPHIDFGPTQLRLKDTSQPLGLQLRQLTFDESGQLTSELASLNSDTPIWRLQGMLPLHGTADWQLQTQVNFAPLYQVQQQLADSQEAEPLLVAYPWLAPDWLVAGAKVHGNISAAVNLSRKTGALAADVCWQAPAISFPQAADTAIQLQGTASASQSCPRDAIALHYAQQADGSEIALAPLRLNVSLTEQQRKAWQQWLPAASSTLPAVEQALTQLHQQLSLPNQTLPNNHDVGVQFDVAQGVQLRRNANNDWRATLPTLMIKPRLFQWLNVNDAAVLTLAFEQTQATLPAADLQQLSLRSAYQFNLALPQGLKLDSGSWSASGSALALQLPGELSWHGSNNQAELSLAADAALSTDKLMAQFGAQHFSMAHLHTAQQGEAKARWHNGVWQFNLPATSHRWQQIQAELPPQKLSLQQLDASLPAISSLTLDSQQALLPQLTQQALKGELTLALELPHISTTKKSRFGGNSDESLLNLSRVSLAQQLDWHNSQLHSQETWQIDNVTLHSKHQLALQPHGYQMQANWQMQTALTALQQIAAKNFQLEDNWQITGQSQFDAQVALSQQGRQLALDVDMQPQLIGAAGQYLQLPFADLNLSANCHYRLRLAADTLDSSNIGCQQFALNASSFNPGLQLSQIDIRGRGDLVPMALNTKVDSWLLPGVKDAKLQLRASAAALNGMIIIPDFNLDLQGKSHGVLLVQGMDIEQLLAQHPQESISATGIFDGVLPMTMENRQVSISGGHLAARNEGVIEIHNTPAIAQMRQSQPYLDYVLDFMQHLQYQEILGKLDMNGLGDTNIELKIKGHGQGIDRPVHLNYSHEENLLQLLQSLTIGERLQSGLEASMQ